MAKNPTFNLKTGADSDLIVAREVTDSKSPDLGKIKRNDGIFHFPYLTRRTGDSLTGTTENIESNELRHGRTRSAPRKGTSSSSGDINWEFSAETFDDMIEAVFRGKWTRWTKDPECSTDGYFKTKCGKTTGSKKLIYDSTGTDDNEGLVHVKDNNKDAFVVHELKCGTEDIKYSLMKKYGGVTGEDLWQEFYHCALNTMQLSVEINSIITGSFGIMGTNNPKLMDTGEAAIELQSRIQGLTEIEDLVWKGEYNPAKTYAVKDVVEHDGKYYRCTTAINVAEAWTPGHWTELDSDEYIENIPDKATDTIQFTAREGFLYINGEQIEFAQSLSFNLDNGLTQKFAIFVPNAISTTPLTLDITGDLSTYLVGGDSQAKKLFNDAVGDKTVELVFCIQDKLDDPTALYLFQIFNAKHTENTINGNGEDTFDESLPWSSFGEQACRILRIILPRITSGEKILITASTDTVYTFKGDWAASTAYAVGDIVVNSDARYKCTEAHTSGDSFDGTKFTAFTPSAGEYVDRGDWAISTDYAKSDIVKYDSKNYKCTEAHTSAAAFDDKKWEMYIPAGTGYSSIFMPNIMLETSDIKAYNASTQPDGFKVTVKINGVDKTADLGLGTIIVGGETDATTVPNANVIFGDKIGESNYGMIIVKTAISPIAQEQNVDVKVEWYGNTYSMSYVVPHS